MKQIIIIAAMIICCTAPGILQAQGMAVNTSGTTADASAILDASSTNQGMLVPRMTSTQRDLISTPANGLLIYQTNNTPGFYYYNGTAWTAVSGGSPGGSGYSFITAPATLADASGKYIVTTGGTITLPATPTTGTDLYIIGAAYNIKINMNGKTFLDVTGWQGQGYLYTITAATRNLTEVSAGALNHYFTGTIRIVYDGAKWVYTPY